MKPVAGLGVCQTGSSSTPSIATGAESRTACTAGGWVGWTAVCATAGVAAVMKAAATSAGTRMRHPVLRRPIGRTPAAEGCRPRLFAARACGCGVGRSFLRRRAFRQGLAVKAEQTRDRAGLSADGVVGDRVPAAFPAEMPGVGPGLPGVDRHRRTSVFVHLYGTSRTRRIR